MYKVTEEGIECITAAEVIELLKAIRGGSFAESQGLRQRPISEIDAPVPHVSGPGKRRNKHWTPGEMAYLKAAFGSRGIRELSRMFGRTGAAVTAKWYELQRKAQQA